MKLTRRDLVMLALLLVVVGVGGLWWFVVKPANADANATRHTLHQVETENNAIRDTIARLEPDDGAEVRRTVERLRLAKALPVSGAVPGAVVQLERLARGAAVQLSGFKTTSSTDHGAVRATELEVRVRGRFFDVDDFLFRMHRLVAVDDRDRPVVGGRLFATTSIDMTLVEEDAGDGSRLRPDDEIDAVLKVVAFSSAEDATAEVSDGGPQAQDGDDAPAPADSADDGQTQ